MTDYVLLAGGGGSQLRVTAVAASVGRDRGADLVVRDPTVSRRHLEVRAADDGVQVEVIAGAAPFVYAGQPVTSACIPAGAHLIVGSTVLSVVAAGTVAAVRTETDTLAHGLAADVRGLSAVIALVEDLADAEDADQIAAAVDRWAREVLGARSARLVERAPSLGPGDARELVTRLPGSETCLVIELAAAGDVDHAMRGAAAVAAACVTASLSAARVRTTLRAQTAELRTIAVGSARSFLGGSRAAVGVDALVGKLAASEATALIVGESGTGKTFVARLIHEASPRARAPLRVINCAAVPETLLEAELFGSERGAYSGAVATRIGAFEAAGDGTLLLDEIGELSLPAQAKLLHAVEERRFERLGSNRAIPLRARILTATNRDLRAMVEAGTFRRDLYFRISVVVLAVPPLRDRDDDVVMLADRMLADLAPSVARRVTGFAPSAVAALRAYAWPGNARELRNAIEHALVLGEGPLIEAGDLPELVRGGVRPAGGQPPFVVELPADLRWLEERAIEAALARTGGNRTKAAALLGINRVTLQKKLR